MRNPQDLFPLGSRLGHRLRAIYEPRLQGASMAVVDGGHLGCPGDQDVQG